MVVQHGNSWQATMRNGAWSAVGEFRPTFDEAVASGHEAFAKMISERKMLYESRVTEAKSVPKSVPKATPYDPLEDL